MKKNPLELSPTMRRALAGSLLTITSVVISCKKEEVLPTGSAGPSVQAPDLCLPQNPQQGLIAYYPFNSGSLLDASGNGRDLINNTTAVPAFDKEGNATCAYEFERDNHDYLVHADPQFLDNLDEVSVSLWYMSYTENYDSPYEILLGRDTIFDCGNNGLLQVFLHDCRQAAFYYRQNSVWAAQQMAPFDCTQMADSLNNVWHHVVAVRSTAGVRVYFDGVYFDGNGTFSPCDDIGLFGDLFIGFGYSGKIDDVAIYNRALSEPEALQLYGLPVCCGQ